jgi:hypothetical protein
MANREELGDDTKEGGDDFFHNVPTFVAKSENMTRNSVGDPAQCESSHVAADWTRMEKEMETNVRICPENETDTLKIRNHQTRMSHFCIATTDLSYANW